MGFAKTAAALVFVLACGTAHAYFSTGRDLLAGFAVMSRIGTSQAKATDPQQAARVAGYIQGALDSALASKQLCTNGLPLTVRTAEPKIKYFLANAPSFLDMPGVFAVHLAMMPEHACP